MEASCEAPISTPPAQPRRRRWWLFLGLTLLLLLVGQEVACRWLFPLPEVPAFNRVNYMVRFPLKEDDVAKLGRDGLHNVTIRWESEPDGFTIDEHLNMYGFRGPDFSIHRQPGRSRVLFIGDSYTEGYGANDNETIPEQVGQMMGGRIEPINLGVCATGFGEYARLTRDALALLHPDHVVLVCCYNDFPAQPLLPEVREPAPAFAQRKDTKPRSVEIITQLCSGKAVPSVFSRGPYPFFTPVPSSTNPLSGLENGFGTSPLLFKPLPKNLDSNLLNAMWRGKLNPWMARMLEWAEPVLRLDFSQWGGVRDQLGYIADLCRKHQVQLTVVYIPSHLTLNPEYLTAAKRFGGDNLDKVTDMSGPEYRAQQRHLKEVTKALGVPFLDMTDVLLKAEKDGTRTYWPYDCHCNAAGYRLIAEQCAKELDKPAPPATAQARR